MRRGNGALLLVVLLLLGCHSKEEKQSDGITVHERVNQIINMEISDVDPSRVPDGNYTGEVPFMRHLYRVKVTVESGRIEKIDVLENGTENEYARKGLGVIPRIMNEQSPRVDAITGATVTSRALMKCVEKALKKSR